MNITIIRSNQTTVFGLVVTVAWSIVDRIMIICGSYPDNEGRKLTQWT